MTDASARPRLAAALADHYRLDRELGQGGMATVWLAEDLKHQRRVAIKVLKPDLAAVLGAERFVQEITTTASLQHPHILPLFDSGTAEGFLFYVMPYIEGETLRDKLSRETQLGIEEAIRITTEVADALDYAHRQGVIHRDIKPENILLHDGRPMVADFGIALAVSAAAGGRMTETGLSLGTPHYMSPEQATADKEISARSDIYSLASVLYEALAGAPPHLGGSAQQVIMKIIAEPAPLVTTLRKSVPPHVAAALAKALEKLPADRFASAREFSDALLGRGPAPGLTSAAFAPGSARPAALARHPLVLGLSVALVGALAWGVAQWRNARREFVDEVVRFTIEAPSAVLSANAGVGTSVAVSPDGTTIAYTSSGASGAPQLFVRKLGDTDPVPLAGTEGAHQPAFSPDGKWIAYMVQEVIWKVEVGGGTPIMVGRAGAAPVGLTWGPRGLILAGTTGGIVGIPAAGGGAPRVLAAYDGDLYFFQPRALLDPEIVLFTFTNLQNPAGRLAAYSFKTDRVTRFDLDLFDALGVIDGWLVYVTPAGALMAIRVDLEAGRAEGDPVALGETVVTRVVGASEAALSASGTLVYQSGSPDVTLGWAGPGGFVPALTEARRYWYPRLSPNGRRVAVAIESGGRSDVWTWDLASSTLQRLTNAGVGNDRPEWTPDGRHVLYRSNERGRSGILSIPSDLSGPSTPLHAGPLHDFFEGVVSPDGRALVYQIDDGGATQSDVLYRLLEGDTTSRPISASTFSEAQARLSPNGRWVAFVTDAPGRSEVVVQPFPGPGGRVQVSDAGGAEPVWSRDGRRIFYRDGRHLIAADVTTGGGFAVTGRTALFADEYVFAPAPHANYDVSLDGRRFLMAKSVQVPEFVVVHGWLTEFRARVRQAEAP